MSKLTASLLGITIIAKYGMLLKKEISSLDDKITAERSIDLIGEAVASLVKDLDDRQARSEVKPKGEA